MIWFLLLAAFAIALLIRLRLRRRRVAILRSESLSTVHGGLARKQDAKKRAALDAASAGLR